MLVGQPEGEQYRLTYVFTEIDRSRRLAATFSMDYISEGRTERSTVSVTFEDQDGKTFLTLVQGGFETGRSATLT